MKNRLHVEAELIEQIDVEEVPVEAPAISPVALLVALSGYFQVFTQDDVDGVDQMLDIQTHTVWFINADIRNRRVLLHSRKGDEAHTYILDEAWFHSDRRELPVGIYQDSAYVLK